MLETSTISPQGERNNQRRKRRGKPDLGGSVKFDDLYRADAGAVMRGVKEVAAYIDTVELYFAGMRPDGSDFRALRKKMILLQSARKSKNGNYKGPRFKPVVLLLQGQPVTVGWRYVVNQPVAEALHVLDQIMTWPRVSLHRFDMAVDFLTGKPRQADAVRQHLLRHFVMRWNKSPYMPDVLGETTYWCRYKNLRKRPTRNALVYADKKSKLRDQPCCHFEMRFSSAAAVARQGIELPSDLIRLDVPGIIRRNFYLVGDYWDALNRLLERDPNSHRYRHLNQDFRAQNLHRNHRIRFKRLGLEVLKLPSVVSFGEANQ